MTGAQSSVTEKCETERKTQGYLHETRMATFVRTDRFFSWLMLAQWIAGIIAALIISPRAWAGTSSSVHVHVWAALFLGGAISFFPAWLAWVRPGRSSTRHIIVASQMLTSGLLIHLTGGRIETHFHVFGSLALLSFYRDWRVFLTATLVVGLDHLLRGIYFPLSVYGVSYASPWRSVEHAGWVLFENVFLVWSTMRSNRETEEICRKRAQLEVLNQSIEASIQERILDLRATKADLEVKNWCMSILQTVTSIANDSRKFSDACHKVLYVLLKWAGNGYGRVTLVVPAHEAGNVQATGWISVMDQGSEPPQNNVSPKIPAMDGNTEPTLDVPITAHGKLIAVLELYDLPQEALSENHEVVYWQVADQLTRVLEREMAEEERRHLQDQLVDASHQAGMAEVATGVLHNVGNVLNSVNVAAEVIGSKLRQSKLDGVEKVCELLERERLNLPTFFSTPGKSDQLVIYVRKVADQLKSERGQIEDELTDLVKSINHIKQTVARQQEQAKLSGVQMNVLLSELLEEALFMHEGSLSRHHIEVLRDYGELQSQLLEKHKVLQILVNLITNATHAMSEASEFQKVLTLRCGYDAAGQPFAEVEDTGVGINSEHMSKLFFFGFTTKKEGHGFGLHSCALAAKQLGAKLTAHSDGAGKGAKFRLTFQQAGDLRKADMLV